MKPEELNEQLNDNLEYIQKAIVDAGGRFFTRAELSEMTVRALVKLMIPNNIKMKVKYQYPSPGVKTRLS